MKNKIIVIDKSRLPTNKEKSMDILFDYFSDHEIEITESHTHYYLELNRSDFLYCENVENGLKGFGINKKDVIGYYIIAQQNFFCLLESWIPYGWSKFMSETQFIPDSLTIIHLDDHTDLMSPKISADNDRWKDMLTGEIVNFSEPESIKKAVQSGAITVGSMMTPLIHYIRNVDVFHLMQNAETVSRYIQKSTNPDTLICPEEKRMSINFTCKPDNKGVESNIYLKTSHFSEIIKSIRPKTDIFLHIDMDYFNNRFNGSTDWANHPLKHNPQLDKQKENMKIFCQNISKAGLTGRIKHVSIGISPSFYPSEYWKEGTAYLLNRFDSIGLKVATLEKKLKLNEANLL
jgi:hypothetical protein